MMSRFMLLTSSLLFTTTSFALFCPNGFNQINFGDTIEQVQAQCGKPDSQKKYTDTSNVPQEWTYYLKMNPTDQGTIKVTFSFVNNQVTNLTANGIGVGSTTICNGITLQLTSSTDDVKSACGTPALVTKTNLNAVTGESGPSPSPDQNVVWTYNTSPPVHLTFEKGKLKSRD